MRCETCHGQGEVAALFEERAKFVMRKLTDDELNAFFLRDQERCDLAAALGCDPSIAFLLVTAEDRFRCLSRPLEADQVTAAEEPVAPPQDTEPG